MNLKPESRWSDKYIKAMRELDEIERDLLQEKTLKLNHIYNEDCLDTMKRMPDGFIDLTVTSPPYDNLREYKGYSFDFELIAQELYRVTKQGGVIVWVVGDATIKGSETGTSFRQALHFKELGFNLHDTMIFVKKNPIPLTHNRYEQGFEYMFVFSKGRPAFFSPLKERTLDPGKNEWRGNSSRTAEASFRSRDEHTSRKSEKYRTNVWPYGVGAHQSNGSHPAVFPLGLARDHTLSWSKETDTVYDPFMGSGTTALACKDLGRNYIGSEISKEYCEIAEARLAQGVLDFAGLAVSDQEKP